MNSCIYHFEKKEVQEQLFIMAFLTVLIIYLPISILFGWTQVDGSPLFISILAMVMYTFISLFLFHQLLLLCKYFYMELKGIPALEITSGFFIDRTGLRNYKYENKDIERIEIYTKRFYHIYPSLLPLMQVINSEGKNRVISLYHFEKNKSKLKRNLESLGYKVKLLGIKK